MGFEELQIIEPILKALQEEGYKQPTPIQAQAIPIVLEGHDLLGIAQTGTGKTAAFAIPILQKLHAVRPQGKERRIRALVVTPTRELAIQIEESFRAYGRHLHLTCTVIFGGVNQSRQIAALRKGVDVVIATPGRLLDLFQQGHISLDDIHMFVLDEADRMLDMGFLPDVKKLVARLPQKRQSLFFSATMPYVISQLAHQILDHPQRVEVTPPSTTVERIDQTVYYIGKPKKSQLLIHLLDELNIESALVFTRTKHGADVVTRILNRANIAAEAIHSNKTQNARQKALTAFKAGRMRVLVATDIAARGIDIDDLEYVFNYDIPDVAETYVHRIGRTGRAGAAGKAIAFCSSDERDNLRAIERLTGKKIETVPDHPFASSDVPAHRPAVAKTPPNASADVVAERMRELAKHSQQGGAKAPTEPRERKDRSGGGEQRQRGGNARRERPPVEHGSRRREMTREREERIRGEHTPHEGAKPQRRDNEQKQHEPKSNRQNDHRPKKQGEHTARKPAEHKPVRREHAHEHSQEHKHPTHSHPHQESGKAKKKRGGWLGGIFRRKKK
ncbi:MAG: DEAD/DEAH box helicase [Bacteroidetes bacterium]|nr:DEAD/DEAH box helicase [Bacteroidota bacterium]